MPEGCYQVEELAEIAGLDPHDPRLEHARKCARCRALLVSYREFVAPSRVRAGSDPADAQDRLTAFVAQDILGSEPQQKDHPWGRLWHALRTRPLRPALAMAGSLAVLLVIVTLVDYRDSGPDRIILREESRGEAVLTLEPAEVVGAGQVQLSWHPIPGADTYQVTLLGSHLGELAQLAAGADTALTFDPAAIPDLPSPGSAILWQVVAFRGGDEHLRSRPQSMRLP